MQRIKCDISNALYVLVLWKQPSFKQTSPAQWVPQQQQMPDAHTSWDCVEAQRGNDAWQNEDVVDLPHQRLECSSTSSTGEPCDEGSFLITLTLVYTHQMSLRHSLTCLKDCGRKVKLTTGLPW